MKKTFIRREHDIEAVQWTGKNLEECEAFTNGYVAVMLPDGEGNVNIRLTSGLFTRKVAEQGDWIVKDGELVTVWKHDELLAKTTGMAFTGDSSKNDFADAKGE